jgi:hypothetical protein
MPEERDIAALRCALATLEEIAERGDEQAREAAGKLRAQVSARVLSTDPAPIKPGLYRTTEDVENPSPDRRQRRDWRKLVTIPAGTLITVREDIDFPGQPVMCSGQYTHHWIGPNRELYTRLARVLTPAPLGLATWSTGGRTRRTRFSNC